MLTMYDSVDLAQIPREPAAVACYINGHYANAEEAAKEFPNARLLHISVTGRVAADAYDIEKGDYTAADVAELYTIAKTANVWRPCFYADLANMPAVKEELNRVVNAREDIRLWVAYYNGTPDIPTGYDAHQFTSSALGRNLDESICSDTFFQPVKPKPDDSPKYELVFNGEVYKKAA